MERSTQEPAGTGVSQGLDGGAFDGGARVPTQSRAERAPGGGPVRGGVGLGPGSGGGAGAGAVRGEHTHGEAASRPRPAVQRASVRGQILDALRTALVGGELTPGEVYSAPVLGERFGVSATPVREAMQQLALEGAVEVVPNRGFRVVVRGARELAELAEVRALIEVPVMLRLARTVPAERWAQLRPLAEATVHAAGSGCRATYAESDRAFHRAVLGLCGNEQLVGVAEELHRRSQWPLVGGGGGPAARGRADLVADAAEHMALLEALGAGDLDVVRALVREHFAGAA
ncbi:GntR family transcriptional regulator [Streptomyces sp. NPDC006172]|uniref:GntR family transcriptional regulator n=1 Tax=Streptomyces sp. NPDC006172 TaxID=3154470 RepID=UPI00340EBD83